MSKLLANIPESVILQGIIALLCWGVIGYLSIMGQEIPDVLVAGASAITGYLFRSNNHKENGV